MKTLYLDPESWDLVLDAWGNIALASEPYSQSQDAASAIKTFEGECFYDTTLGIPYWTQVLGHAPPLALVKSYMVEAALTVPGVAAAAVYFTGLDGRRLSGQVQISNSDGTVSVAEF